MSKHDLMRDPFYAQLMFVIESSICRADRDAQQKGIRLTDSNIKSALNRARRLTPQAAQHIPGKPVETREDIIGELASSIAVNRMLLGEEIETEDGEESAEVSCEDWTAAISAVEASLKVRRSNEPGGRDYLDYVRNFIEKHEGSGSSTSPVKRQGAAPTGFSYSWKTV